MFYSREENLIIYQTLYLLAKISYDPKTATAFF